MASLSDAIVKQLLESRYIASFATHNPNGSIHIVAVWFWFDGTDIYVATASRSRKARNLQANPQVSLMVDSRDPAASYGVTVTGSAEVLSGESSHQCNTEIHRKYLSDAALADPKVGPVFAGWDDNLGLPGFPPLTFAPSKVEVARSGDLPTKPENMR